MPCLRTKTISPIRIPSFLKVGINTNSSEYMQLVHEIDQIDDKTVSFNSLLIQLEYRDLDEDVKDIRIFKWADPDSEHPLAIHVFPNGVGVVEIDLELEDYVDADQLEECVQALSASLINASFPRFLQSLDGIDQQINHPYWQYSSQANTRPFVHWISRAVLLSQPELTTHANLIEQWLSETKRPEDAQDIINGHRDHSMTWLNYLLVDQNDSLQKSDADYRIEAMVLAQYYYTAQENCNNQLKQAIDIAYRDEQSKQAEKKLSSSRVAARLHYISYHEQLKYLIRIKRAVLIDILDAWQFESLVENGQRMIEVCSAKLEAVDNQRRERSSMMTDLLLVALSFFTVFELSMSLTGFSREMMSRPTLDYNDERQSIFLSFIANVDVDVMISLGFGLTLLLIIVYRIMKR